MANSKKKCRQCKTYERVETGIEIGTSFYCSEKCKVEFALSSGKKAYKKIVAIVEKKQRADTRKRKKEMLTRSDWIKKAQASFNAYIRTRDQNKCCISSNRPLTKSGIGGGFDCGHYRSVGSAPNLRFNVFNAHGQSKHDNRYLSGNAVEYRIYLIKRIGLDKVERLEQDNRVRKFDIDYLKRIQKIFNKKTRLYKTKFRG